MRILPVALSFLTLSACALDDTARPLGRDDDDAITIEETHEDALSLGELGHAIARASLFASDDLLAASVSALGEADGVWPWLTDDASYLHPGVPLLGGRGNIRDFLRATYPDRHAQTLHLHRETGDASTDATVGYTFGWFDEDVATADGGRATKYGKYIATWTRSIGAWQLAGLVRVPGTRAPSAPPADAAVFAGEHGVPSFAGSSAARAQAMAADSAFAQLSVNSGYTIAFTTFASSSAVVVGASDFFWGPAGVAYAYGGWAPGEALDWGPVVGRGAASGDLAYTVGTAVYSYTTASGVQRAYSKYLTVWVRQADGSWRFVIDGGNASPAPVL